MKKYLIALALIGVAMTSCYEKLNIAPPNAITAEQVKEKLATADDATVEVILGSIVSTLRTQFRSGGYDQWNNSYWSTYQGQDALRNFTGNDIVMGGASAPSGDAGMDYEGININTNTVTYPYWKRVYAANTAVSKVAIYVNEELLASNPKSAKIQEYLGQVYTTRAYAYLFALETFASSENGMGVPIYTKYDLAQELQPRASYQATVDSVMKWAARGAELLEAAGVSYEPTVLGDITPGVANFVLARAAVVTENWATAIAATDKLIAAYPKLMTEAEYVNVLDSVVTIDSKDYPVYSANGCGFVDFDANDEIILGFNNANKGGGVHNYWMNGFSTCARIDTRLYDLIAPADYRKANFSVASLGTLKTPGANTFIDGQTIVESGTYQNLKFTFNVGIDGTPGKNTEASGLGYDYPLFRVSEAYLMKAEAQAMNGDEAGAFATLDILVDARTNGALTCSTYPSMAGMTALQMVQLQTRIEMWGERGLEWYNNKRWGIDVNRTNSLHWNNGMTYSADDMLLFLPLEELNVNPLVKQN